MIQSGCRGKLWQEIARLPIMATRSYLSFTVSGINRMAGDELVSWWIVPTARHWNPLEVIESLVFFDII